MGSGTGLPVKHFGQHTTAIDDLDRAVAGSHELFVGDDTNRVVNSGCPVNNAEWVFFRLAGG